MKIRDIIAVKPGCTLIAPFAGDGAKLLQLAQSIGVDSAMIFASDPDRMAFESLRRVFPPTNLPSGPASIDNLAVFSESASIVCLNPRSSCEVVAIQHATPWLTTGGILAMVCHSSSVEFFWSGVRQHLHQYFDDLSAMPLQDGSVVVFGVKRRHPQPSGQSPHHGANLIAPTRAYPAPLPYRKCSIARTAPTDDEIAESLSASPLTITAAKRLRRLPRPPLPIGPGHAALVLASGKLDGIVRHPGEQPHVVRGVTVKVPSVTSTIQVDNAGRSETITTTTERIELLIRTVDAEGNFRDFQPNGAKL